MPPAVVTPVAAPVEFAVPAIVAAPVSVVDAVTVVAAQPAADFDVDLAAETAAMEEPGPDPRCTGLAAAADTAVATETAEAAAMAKVETAPGEITCKTKI